MKKKTTICAIESVDYPLCPNCKADLPIPGLENFSYECPACKRHYRLDYQMVRVFKTQIWLTGNEA